MTSRLWIPGRLPGLNELLAACKGPQAYHRYRRLKNQWMQDIALYAKAAQLRPRGPGTHILFDWIDPNRKRDQDNVCAGGRKFLLDGLVSAGVLPGDGWSAELTWADKFAVNKAQPGVLLTLMDP